MINFISADMRNLESSAELSAVPRFSTLDLTGGRQMATHAIISYDDTQDDHDALMMGRVLAEAGAELTLAYVRHAVQSRPDHEKLAHGEAEALLGRGADWLGRPEVERRVVISPSTGQ